MILKKVQEILANMLGYDDPSEIQPSFSFEDDLRMDGGDLYEMYDLIDGELGTDLNNCEENFLTVKQLVAYIKKERLNE